MRICDSTDSGCLLLNDKDLNVVIVVKHVLLKEVWKNPLILELDLIFLNYGLFKFEHPAIRGCYPTPKVTDSRRGPHLSAW